MRWILLAALSLIVLSGCSTNPPGAVQATGPAASNRASGGAHTRPGNSSLIVTPGSAFQGQVATVNFGSRFAVLSFPIGRLPPLEKRLNVYRNGLKVGEVRVTGPQRDNNTVADIIAGDCQPGDQVRED